MPVLNFFLLPLDDRRVLIPRTFVVPYYCGITSSTIRLENGHPTQNESLPSHVNSNCRKCRASKVGISRDGGGSGLELPRGGAAVGTHVTSRTVDIQDLGVSLVHER